MSAESEREAAHSVQQFAADLNTAIDHARSLGLRVDISVDMEKLKDSPLAAPHISARILKPIDP